MKLNNKVAIVTGSSRGIGKSIALAFAKEGADVVITYKSEETKAKEVVNAIKALKRDAIAVKVDVSQRKDLIVLVQETMKHFRRIDILVNNAGINKPSDFLDITEEDWDAIIDTNLKGAFLCSQEVLKVMKEQKSGVIINISSVSGQYGGPRTCHYAVSKAGLIMMGYNLALNFAKYNIRVINIAPGVIESEMAKAAASLDLKIPLQRLGKADEVAKAAVFLASDDASYITAFTMNVNGGLYF
ncbi:3-oxoacyl-ACP reductase FabG [Candidatus Woesearchaeota archaeon]|nr:3-oxoacyl-ACP reductase FabG [Candidatus Woesearchaeota archaeon]